MSTTYEPQPAQLHSPAWVAVTKIQFGVALAAVVVERGQVGLAYADITTSEFATGQFDAKNLADELARLAPAEILVPDGEEIAVGDLPTVELPLYAFGLETAAAALKRHFGVKDSGRLLPGHGGAMDRFDGLVAAVLVVALVAWWRGQTVFIW